MVLCAELSPEDWQWSHVCWEQDCSVTLLPPNGVWVDGDRVSKLQMAKFNALLRLQLWIKKVNSLGKPIVWNTYHQQAKLNSIHPMYFTLPQRSYMEMIPTWSVDRIWWVWFGWVVVQSAS